MSDYEIVEIYDCLHPGCGAVKQDVTRTYIDNTGHRVGILACGHRHLIGWRICLTDGVCARDAETREILDTAGIAKRVKAACERPEEVEWEQVQKGE
jgi:hypothetical protein